MKIAVCFERRATWPSILVGDNTCRAPAIAPNKADEENCETDQYQSTGAAKNDSPAVHGFSKFAAGMPLFWECE